MDTAFLITVNKTSYKWGIEVGPTEGLVVLEKSSPHNIKRITQVFPIIYAIMSAFSNWLLYVFNLRWYQYKCLYFEKMTLSRVVCVSSCEVLLSDRICTESSRNNKYLNISLKKKHHETLSWNNVQAEEKRW
jgi:hypothetical protein